MSFIKYVGRRAQRTISLRFVVASVVSASRSVPALAVFVHMCGFAYGSGCWLCVGGLGFLIGGGVFSSRTRLWNLFRRGSEFRRLLSCFDVSPSI